MIVIHFVNVWTLLSICCNSPEGGTAPQVQQSQAFFVGGGQKNPKAPIRNFEYPKHRSQLSLSSQGSASGPVLISIKWDILCLVHLQEKTNQSCAVFLIYAEQVVIMESYEDYQKDIFWQKSNTCCPSDKGFYPKKWSRLYLPLNSLLRLILFYFPLSFLIRKLDVIALNFKFIIAKFKKNTVFLFDPYRKTHGK